MVPGRGSIRRQPAAWLFALFLFALVISLILFRNNKGEIPRRLVQAAVIWLALIAIVEIPVMLRHWKKTLLVLVSTGLGVALVALAGPPLLKKKVLREYQLTIDHRLKPEPGLRNEDGIAPDVPANQYLRDDFSIIFLGDSYTQGVRMSPSDAFPMVVERALQALSPSPTVRAANFGWGSSSPVLQFRQLRDIGAKYKPDLVVQALDMGDFADDIEYSRKLAEEPDDDHPSEISIFYAMRVRLSQLLGVDDIWRWLWMEPRWTQRAKPATTTPNPAPNVPVDRYFHFFQPLEKSEPLFEITWRTLRETDALAKDLGAKYVLFVLPRYQQYNRNECPLDDQKASFPETDEFLFEAFTFFDKKQGEASFPIHSLLEDFRSSGVFPTTFEDDAHYNVDGHRIVAQAIVRHLVADGLFTPASDHEGIGDR